MHLLLCRSHMSQARQKCHRHEVQWSVCLLNCIQWLCNCVNSLRTAFLHQTVTICSSAALRLRHQRCNALKLILYSVA
jgi:hypothetical protein